MISILLIPLIVAYYLVPHINQGSHKRAMQAYVRQLSTSHDQIDMRSVWQKRTLLTNGYYDKDMSGIAFSSLHIDSEMKPLVTCLSRFSQDVKIVAQYRSDTWHSLEMLVQNSGSNLILKTCLNEPHPQKTMDFRFSKPHSLLFLTVRPLETMKKTIGFIDYEGEHKNIVAGTQWYSLSHVLLK